MTSAAALCENELLVVGSLTPLVSHCELSR